MAAQQIPPSGAQTPATAVERVFERKVRLSKWALLFEQLWPRAWLVLGLAGLFIGASLAGLWPRLPELPHKIVLALFGLAFAIALLALMRVRWPSREQAIRRVEAVSGIKHRPASSYEDTLTLGAADARTAALWRVHRQRLAALLQKLHVGRSLAADRPIRSFRAACAAAAQRLRAPGRGRRQRIRSAALGVPLRRAVQGSGSAHRCLGDAAGLYGQAAHHAGRRRLQRLAAAGEAGRSDGNPRPQRAGRACGRARHWARSRSSLLAAMACRSASRRRRRPAPRTSPSSSWKCGSRGPCRSTAAARCC